MEVVPAAGRLVARLQEPASGRHYRFRTLRIFRHMLEQTLDHLQALVSFDTRNPPRAITTGGIFDYLRDNLPGFNVEVIDHGAGAVSLYAVRGTPKYLFNVHLDTVPDSPHWSADPHVMRRLDDRVVGLGVTSGRRRCAGGGGQCQRWRCRLPVLQRRGSQRSALYRRVPWPVACRMKRCWWPSRP